MCGQSAGLKNQRFVGSIPTSGTMCSISLEVKRGVANAKSRVRVSYIAPYIHAVGEKDITYGYGP